MRAARLHSIGSELTIDDIPKPIAAPGEVVVSVVAAGICGSDLHIIDGENPLPTYPRVLGHEIAGEVDEIGEGVVLFARGDRVCIDFLLTCGDCRFCRSGRESLCANREGIGVQRDGGFAEYVAVPERNLVRVPDGVPLEHAAIATDALATPFHAISKRARVRPGQGAVVIGLGGLGLNAVRLLTVFGADPIVGIDPDEGSRERAVRAGAHFVFDPRGEELGTWLARRRSEIATAFDFVGAAATVEQACRVVARGGRVVVVGLGAETLRMPPATAVVREELEVVGSYSFEREEIRDLMAMLERGDVDVSDSISHRIGLEDVNEGIHRLRSRDGAPSRIVLFPWGRGHPGE